MKFVYLRQVLYTETDMFHYSYIITDFFVNVKAFLRKIRDIKKIYIIGEITFSHNYYDVRRLYYRENIKISLKSLFFISL